MGRIFLFILLVQIGWAQEPCVLDLETAWQKVLDYAPSIAAAEAEVGMLRAEAKQVSLIPNPIGTVESENLGVSNHNDEAEPPETTFALSQLIELGGKRGARKHFALSLTDVAYWDAQLERHNLRLAVMTAFIDVRTAQERVKLALEQEKVAARVLDTTATLVACGKISPIQEKKAQVALMGTQVFVRETLADLLQTKKRLSSLWGCPNPDFDDVDFDLFEFLEPPSQCTALAKLLHTPDFARAQHVIFSATQNYKLQKVNGIPDVVFTAGYTIFHDSNQHGWVIAAEMPLPFFDRNQGNIQKARIGIDQAECQLEEVMRSLSERIILTHERLLASYEEAEMMKEGVLAEAIETCECIQMGYENGKLDYLELLDAQKTLFEIQQQYIDILYDYHLSRAELARLTGECL